MANGASRIFQVISQTSEGNNPNTSAIVSLTVKSLNPIIFIRDEKLEIDEEFCIFDQFIDKSLFKIGDIIIALMLANSQQYYILQNISTKIINQSDIYNIQKSITDTGWLDLPLEDNITVGTIKAKAQYRKIGKIVYIQGDIAGVARNNTLIAKLPNGFRPSVPYYIIQPRSGNAFWRMRIDPNGEILHQFASDNVYNDTYWNEIGCSFITK